MSGADLANLRPFAPHGWRAIGPAMAVLVWGFAGWEALTSLATDYRNPRRDVPKVIEFMRAGKLELEGKAE